MNILIKISALNLFLIFLAPPLFSEKENDFEKGFHFGICKTMMDAFSSGDGKIGDFEFFITSSDGKKIAVFNINKSMESLSNLAQNDSTQSKSFTTRFLTLLKNYRSGSITKNELKEISWLFYNLIYKTNRDGVKFGYLISQVFSSINYINSAMAPENIKRKAINSLWQNVTVMLIFSPYFFNSETSDRLFFAYINQDIKTISDISIYMIVTNLNIPLDPKK